MVEFLSQNVMLVALFVVSGVMLAWPSLASLAGGANNIGTLETTRLMNNNALVLDVRETGEFAGGHIPRTRNVPLAELEKRIGELDKFKGKPVVVVCATNNRSAGAARILKANGFTDIYRLAGGFSAWQAASLPVEK